MGQKYTKARLQKIVKECYSILGVLRRLNLRPSGGTHTYIKGKIKYYKIPTKHFTGQGHNKGKTTWNRKPLEKILCIYPEGIQPKAIHLRRALREIGRPFECENCKNTGRWNHKPLTLEVDHKNRNRQDNRPENLRFLCPNCHSQTLGLAGEDIHIQENHPGKNLKIYCGGFQLPA